MILTVIDEDEAVRALASLAVHLWNRRSEPSIAFARHAQAHRRGSAEYSALFERDVYTARDIRLAYVNLG